MSRPGQQRGVALVLVLWITMLLTITAGSYALLARTENLQSRHLFETTRARYAAEAGLNRAVFELRNPDQETRWIADGRTYEFEFDTAAVEIKITDETGKIDINAADEFVLQSLFASTGTLEEDQILELSDAVLDWRDPDDLTRNYGAEDDDYADLEYPYGAKDAPFDTVAELQQVLGMNYDLYSQLEPAITVHSGRGNPNPAYAPLSVLLTLPDMTPELAEQFIAQREEATELGAPPPVLPDGSVAVARGGGLTYSISSRATLSNGAWTEIEATVRLGGSFLKRPYRIVRWKT